MAGSPKYKVYTAGGEYIASCKYLEDCAVLVGVLGAGAQVRSGHSTVIWREGSEEIPAGESYDRAAAIMEFHEQDERAKAHARADSHIVTCPTTKGECHDAAERNEGCFRAVRAERERDEARAALSSTECAECKRLTHRLEKIDKCLDELGAPKSGELEGLTMELSRVGRIKSIASAIRRSDIRCPQCGWVCEEPDREES